MVSIDCVLIILIILLLFYSAAFKPSETEEKKTSSFAGGCPYSPPAMYSGFCSCSGYKVDPFCGCSAMKDKFCQGTDEIESKSENFCEDGDEICKQAASTEKFTCLPDREGSGCPLTTAFSGNQLPCESVGVYWIAYSRLIGNKQAWAVTDANGWPVELSELQNKISPGDVVCWAGQPMGRVVSLATHKNVPHSVFMILDRTFEINLSGKTIQIIKASAAAEQFKGWMRWKGWS